MDEKNMHRYIHSINHNDFLYGYGYASSLFFFSNYIKNNDIKLSNYPKAIFSTAEKLFPHMRTTIEEVFNTKVFDTYGLNDGGVSAFECQNHSGMHIDTDRSILEVVDENGNTLKNGTGRIVATSLGNFAMPFIRYNTGDIGTISSEKCPCGRHSLILKEVIGRHNDILQTPEGAFVHGEFFSHIFWEIPGVNEFQVLQEEVERLLIKIVPTPEFNNDDIQRIRDFIKTRSAGWKIDIEIVDDIDRTIAGKFRFVVNNIGKKQSSEGHQSH